ncbi:KxDL motif-containing protein [Drosera capensis]
MIAAEEALVEISKEFKTLIDSDDLESLKQTQLLMSMKSKILAAYPDAFPDGSSGEILDGRPDL